MPTNSAAQHPLFALLQCALPTQTSDWTVTRLIGIPSGVPVDPTTHPTRIIAVRPARDDPLEQLLPCMWTRPPQHQSPEHHRIEGKPPPYHGDHCGHFRSPHDEITRSERDGSMCRNSLFVEIANLQASSRQSQAHHAIVMSERVAHPVLHHRARKSITEDRPFLKRCTHELGALAASRQRLVFVQHPCRGHELDGGPEGRAVQELVIAPLSPHCPLGEVWRGRRREAFRGTAGQWREGRRSAISSRQWPASPPTEAGARCAHRRTRRSL